MESADESTKLWRHPYNLNKFHKHFKMQHIVIYIKDDDNKAQTGTELKTFELSVLSSVSILPKVVSSSSGQ